MITKNELLILCIPAVIAAILLAEVQGYRRGVKSVQVIQLQKEMQVTVDSSSISQKVLADFIPQVTFVHETGKTIREKVPVYVTQKDDSHCTIPNSFVLLWNSANKMQLPNPSDRVDDSRSSVVLSDIAAQHERESEIGNANEVKLRSLQSWVAQQEDLYNK